MITGAKWPEDSSQDFSQPAVSNHIAKLEEELGCALFIRYDKSLILTEKGEQLLKVARSILDKYAEIDALKL